MKIAIDVYLMRMNTESFGKSIKFESFVHKFYNLFLQLYMHCLMIINTLILLQLLYLQRLWNVTIIFMSLKFILEKDFFFQMKMYVCLDVCSQSSDTFFSGWDCATPPPKKLFYSSSYTYVQTLRMDQKFEKQHLESKINSNTKVHMFRLLTLLDYSNMFRKFLRHFFSKSCMC